MGYICAADGHADTLMQSDGSLYPPYRPPVLTEPPQAVPEALELHDRNSLASKLAVSHLQQDRWTNIIIHHSATTKGNASIFDFYHRTARKMENGLAYHFVVGNGSNSGVGEIEISKRWTNQIHGGHVKNYQYNCNSIGICLVGNFEENTPSDTQTESLIELVDYLKNILLQGKPQVILHRDIQSTLCPGRYFPEMTFRSLFG